jgi:GNAT superfamily N-acetyltransferase
MSADVAIRSATRADAPALAPLLDELGYPVEVAMLEGRMARMLARDDEIILIAERHESGSPTALGLLALHVFPVLAYSEDLALIMALVVSERARGLGVGRRLVSSAESLARERGASRLMVTTHVRRADAHAFYERLGFDFTGRRYVKSL